MREQALLGTRHTVGKERHLLTSWTLKSIRVNALKQTLRKKEIFDYICDKQHKKNEQGAVRVVTSTCCHMGTQRGELPMWQSSPLPFDPCFVEIKNGPSSRQQTLTYKQRISFPFTTFNYKLYLLFINKSYLYLRYTAC